MRLLPHDASFFALFEQQGKKTVEGCRSFLEMVEHPTNLEGRAERVKQIEHECDEITHAVVEVPGSFGIEQARGLRADRHFREHRLN